MFVISNGSHMMALATTKQSVKDFLAIRRQNAARQYRPYAGNTHYSKTWPTENAFVATQLRSIRIHEIELEGLIELQDYQTVRSIYNNDDCDVTKEFFTIGEEETKVGERITAKVVKKSLKSFGKVIVVHDKVNRGSLTVTPTPAQFKDMYDKLARISGLVEGWGTITVAPDSLDDYKMTPIIKKIHTIKFVD